VQKAVLLGPGRLVWARPLRALACPRSRNNGDQFI